MVYATLVYKGYVKDGKPTEKYYSDLDNGSIDFGEINYAKDAVIKAIESIYDDTVFNPANTKDRIKPAFQKENFDKKEFQELWQRINKKTYYEVNLNIDNLKQECINSIDTHLSVNKRWVKIQYGEQKDNIENKEQFEKDEAMAQTKNEKRDLSSSSGDAPYDLVGEIVKATQLKREDVAEILSKIHPEKFAMYQRNAEEFIFKVSRLINEQKAIAVVEHIKYHETDQTYDSDIFSVENLKKGALGVDALESKKSLYDLVVVDSAKTEMEFAKQLENSEDVVVYTKLPGSFKISTPMGNYNPDWAVTFKENSGIKHIYFVAETKGSSVDSDLRGKEKVHIDCARKHFETICKGEYVYDYVHDFKELLEKVMK